MTFKIGRYLYSAALRKDSSISIAVWRLVMHKSVRWPLQLDTGDNPKLDDKCK